ncbi:MAG: hypothetical protein ACREQY_15970 [Candidatus Binatia bacterium]
MLKYALLFIFATVSSLLLTPMVRWLACRIGAIDLPHARRVHVEAIPRLGGLAIYGALAVTFSIAFAIDWFTFDPLAGYATDLPALIVGATLVMLLGVIDDFRPLGPAVKLSIQLLAAIVLVSVGYQIQKVGGAEIGLLGVPLTLLWVVGITNAFNLIDGLDGLAAGVGLIVSATLFAILVQGGRVGEALVLCALGGALLGFLRYNFHPARIFLGDSGSLLLGFVLAAVSIQASKKLSTAIALGVPILVLGLPIMDTSLAVARRALGRTAILRPDRGHIHHRLLELGFTHRSAVLVLYGACALSCAGALALVFQRAPNQGLLLAAFGIAAAIGIRRLDYGEMRLLRNGVLLPVFDLPLVNRRLLHVLIDLCFVIGSYLAAYAVWFGDVWSEPARTRFLDSVPLVAFVQIASFAAVGLYRRSYRHTGIDDLLKMFQALTLAVVTAFLARWLVRDGGWPTLGVTILDGYLLATLVIGSRISFRVLDHVFKNERKGGRKVLIYGAGNGGVLALREIRDNPALDMTAVGFLDDDPGKRMRFIHGCAVYGGEELEAFIRARTFDELIVSTQKIPEERVREVAERCALAGIPVRCFRIGWEELGQGAVPEAGARPAVAS